MMLYALFLWASLVHCIGSDVFEGDACIHDGVEGVCRNIKKCEFAQRQIRMARKPKICSFEKFDPVVCCIDEGNDGTASTTDAVTGSATSEQTDTSTSPAVLTFIEDASTQLKSWDGEQCPPIPANETSSRTGRKAWDKCIEYQEKYVYPCAKGRRLDYCWNDLNLFIIGGNDAFQGEYPHMALIGFGEDPKSLNLLCGGSLISDRFVLTAGHCLHANIYENASHVVLGTLQMSKYDQSNVYRIEKRIAHPMYKPPVKYNDIALLQTEHRVKMSDFVIPACIDVGNLGDLESAVATGWGVTERWGKQSEVLQKVTLIKFDPAICSENFVANRHMRLGYQAASQLCYGDPSSSKDTCQGDSGGPLQVKNTKIHCMYTIIGVTSFGRGCGVAGVPALYTRVSEYAEWIESVVWAD